MFKALALLMLTSVPAWGQEGDYEDQEFEPQQEDVADEAPPAQAFAPAEADGRFERVMQKNAYKMEPSAAANFDQGLVNGNLDGTVAGVAPEVVVPLAQWESTRKAIEALRAARIKPAGPAVVLGAADYHGVQREGALALTVRLDVTLGAPGRWKTVPVIGDDVVLVGATRNGKPIPVTVMDGYHVWTTREVGEARIELEVLVPARGPRGSLEFELSVSRTPVTTFSCRFPAVGLEPRIDGAVTESVRTQSGSTELTATLPPTTHIRLVGFKDLGDAESRETKVYAETSTLLSIAQAHADVFSVVRYTILYGRTKTFAVALPPGVTVVAADGEGAFRWVVEHGEGGQDVLRGETAFPIRGAYEISLRLKRELRGSPIEFDAPVPRALGVEREHGWLAIEVPGRLRLEDKAREEVIAVDVRQLPVEMVTSAVTPILRAYRFHAAKARVALEVSRLPEKEPASAAIDHIRAHTVVSAEGQALTELSITLKNRLRPALLMTLPAGTTIRSTTLDGQPTKPTKNDKGEVMLPLRRSAGGERPEPFTLQVVLETEMPALGWVGAPNLSLPAVDLPVSSFAWSVEVPGRNLYSRLTGDVAAERFAGEGRWHRPVMRTGRLGQDEDGDRTGNTETGAQAPQGGEGNGAMPVRMKVPDSGGVKLEYGRYWLPEGQPVTVSFSYLRRSLVAPVSALAAGLIFALALYATRLARLRTTWRHGEGARAIGLGAAAIAVGVAVSKLSGGTLVVLAIVAGVAVALAPPRAALERLSGWWTTLPERWRGRTRAEGPRAWWHIPSKVVLGGMIAMASMTAFGTIVGFIALLARPW